MALLLKRSLTLSGHETSLALEAPFWAVLQAMAAEQGETLAQRIGAVDAGRGARPLASACRLAALAWALGRRGRPDETA